MKEKLKEYRNNFELLVTEQFFDYIHVEIIEEEIEYTKIYHIYDIDYDFGLFTEDDIIRFISERYLEVEDHLDDEELEFFKKFDMSKVEDIDSSFYPDIVRNMYFDCDVYNIENDLDSLIKFVNSCIIEPKN